jgi:PHD/YefM family antitoxin component YafN of YafNO toxin-antitoxin module
VKYVTNERGERTKVIMSIEEYEALIERIEDAEDALEARRISEALKRGEMTRTLGRVNGGG